MTRPGPDPIDAIVSGYRDAQVLFTANRLDLFDALGRGSLNADALAARLETSPRGTRILCDALVALGLLLKEGDRYRNSELALEHLLAGAPRGKRALLRHGAKLYERMAGLYDAVKTGERVPDERLDPRLLDTPQDFARAMADVGRASSVSACDAIDLRGVERLLDVGGGPGVYAVEFARREPGLEVVILDEAPALEVARANVDASGLSQRITLQVGDALEDELGGPYDVVFLSNFIHIYSAQTVSDLLRRCAAALAPNGRLIVKDFLLDDERTSPVKGAIFAVNMLVSTETGDCHTESELRGWLEGAGLEVESVAEVASLSKVVTGRVSAGRGPRG